MIALALLPLLHATPLPNPADITDRLTARVQFQQQANEVEKLLSAYPGANFSPEFREAITTFSRAEHSYREGKYKVAKNTLDLFWEKYPAGSKYWVSQYSYSGGLTRQFGINVGHPVCYYALRMLTECVHFRLSPKSSQPQKTAVWTIVLVGQASWKEPRNIEEFEKQTGQQVHRKIDKRILTNDYSNIREATWLFEEYVQAATEGELKVKLNFVFLPKINVPLEVVKRERNYAGLTVPAWAQIWGAVPLSDLLATDWWWVMYPSALPEAYSAFDDMEFLTGGMGVGPDGKSPCFISDEKWVLRKPLHLGDGVYTSLERRAYMPMWLHHEFFHHLCRVYPEYRMEVKGHDWFNRQFWPKDFYGELEPDYYAEALRLRIKGSNPSLANRLLYAPSAPSVLAKLPPDALVGEYVHDPEQNTWHRGTISIGADKTMIWRNKADVTWKLSPSIKEGVLRTGDDCPYYPQCPYFAIVLDRDANGKHIPKVKGFLFGTSYFRKVQK